MFLALAPLGRLYVGVGRRRAGATAGPRSPLRCPSPTASPTSGAATSPTPRGSARRVSGTAAAAAARRRRGGRAHAVGRDKHVAAADAVALPVQSEDDKQHDWRAVERLERDEDDAVSYLLTRARSRGRAGRGRRDRGVHRGRGGLGPDAAARRRRPRGGTRGAGALGRDEVDGLPPLWRARAPASTLGEAAAAEAVTVSDDSSVTLWPPARASPARRRARRRGARARRGRRPAAPLPRARARERAERGGRDQGGRRGRGGAR